MKSNSPAKSLILLGIISVFLSSNYLIAGLIDFGEPYFRALEFNEDDNGSFSWTVNWDSNGIAFVGRHRMWVWNGEQWTIKGPSSLQALKAIECDSDGTIWCGGFNSLGYFNSNSFDYISILDRIPLEHRTFGEIWKINLEGGNLWAATHNKLMKISDDNFNIFEFRPDDRVTFFFLQNGIFAHVVSEGLYRITGNRKELLIEREHLQDFAIMWMEDLDGSIVRAISGDRLIELDVLTGNITKKVHFENRISGLSAINKINSKSYVLGTLGRGLFILSEKGDVLKSYSEDHALGNLVVLNMVIDPNGELWILHTGGIIISPISKSIVRQIKNTALFKGLVRSVVDDKSRLFIGTTNGLKEVLTKGNQENEIHEILYNEISKISEFNSVFYVDGYKILYRITGGKAEIAYAFKDEIVTYEYMEPGYLHVVFEGKISSYRIEDKNELSLLNEYATTASVTEMETDAEGIAWGWSEKSPIYGIGRSGEDEFQVETLDSISGLSMTEVDRRISITAGGPVIVTEDSIMRRDPETGNWEADPLETGMGIPQAQVFIKNEDGLKGHMVYFDPETKCNLIVQVSWNNGKVPEWKVVPWLDMRDIGKIVRLKYSEDSEPTLMVIGMKGILTAELALSEQIPLPNKPVVWNARDDKPAAPSYEYSFHDQGGRFVFGSPGHEMYYPVRYQTRVSGISDDWSEPTDYSDKEIGHLFEGSYKFEVRAVDPFGRLSEAQVISLVIHPPLYRSVWAYLFYAVAGLLLLLVIIKLVARGMRVRQIELESLVLERTRELDRANSIKDDFIANLSHEIRNPLNGVIGLIRQLKEGSNPAMGSVVALKSAADYLHRTVEEVLDFSKLETGKVSISRNQFNLEEMAMGVIEIYRRQADDKGLIVDCAIWNPDNLAVVSDESKIQQMLGNLVNNAVKFTHSGRIDIEIGLHATGSCSEIRLRVKDTGCGLSEDDHEKVFNKFYQVRNGDQPVNGTGLGLTLVKAFAEKLGGKIDMCSELGTGTEISVTIPVETVVVKDPGPGETVREDLGLRVLIVEDMEYNRLHLIDFLERVGCDVEAAADGLAGIKLAREKVFDVILLDWELPGMNGYEISTALRGDEEFPVSTRIFAMTAYTGADIRAKCIEAGMNAFLSKPLDVDKLYQELLRRYIIDAGNLAEMNFKGDWESHKARWLNIFEDHQQCVERAIHDQDLDTAARESHGLLGHLRMIRTREIGDCLLDLMTAAKAGDLDGAKMEWGEFTQRIPRFLREFKFL